jgi:hypothetical protein
LENERRRAREDDEKYGREIGDGESGEAGGCGGELFGGVEGWEYDWEYGADGWGWVVHVREWLIYVGIRLYIMGHDREIRLILIRISVFVKG